MKKIMLCLTLLALGLSDFVLHPPRPQHGQQVKAAVTDQADRNDNAASSSIAAPDDSSASPTEDDSSDRSSQLDEHIRDWIAMLAKQPAFSEWSDAEYETYPLGPGTHSWVVLLIKNGNEIGYLVVTSDKDGQLSLSEYGAGDKPLFSLQTLYQSMMQREIISNYTLSEFAAEPLLQKERYYEGPLESFWKVTLRHDTFYFDAKTGERMPVLETIAEREHAEPAAYGGLTVKQAAIEEQTAVTPFDPNENPTWIAGTPLSFTTIDDLKRELAQTQELTYSAKLLGGQAIYPLAVTGFTIYSGGVAYLAVDHDGDRYVPYQHMAALGHFFR